MNIRFFLYLVLLIFIVMSSAPSYAVERSAAVENEQSTAYIIAQQETYQSGEAFWLALHIDMKDGWHTYWENPGDSGIPTRLELDLPEGFSVSDIYWPSPIRFELSGIVNYGYSDDAYHFVRVTPPADFNTTFEVVANASWLICDDICIPEYAENMKITLAPSSQPIIRDSVFQTHLSQVPQHDSDIAAYNIIDEQWVMQLPKDYGSDVSLFPLDNNSVSNETLPHIYTIDDITYALFQKGNQHYESPRFVVKNHHLGTSSVIVAERDHDLGVAVEVTSTVDDLPEPHLGFWLALLLAFGGGVILNLMPCVLPVLSLKALGLVKLAHHDRRDAAAHGVAYTLGILLSFLCIAVILIIIQQAGAEIGWGFQLQSPAFVVALIFVMSLVGMNLSGMYELPSFFGNVGHSYTTKHTRLGSFFTGMLATLVATPCTAPLMAPALGYALTQPPVILIVIFLSLGLGLAAPFLLISLIPGFVRILPKAGHWMLGFRQLLAFPIYATVAWLIWVLTRQYGTSALAVIFASLIMLAFGVWMMMRAKKIIRILGAVIIISAGALAFSHSYEKVNATPLQANTQAFSMSGITEAQRKNQPVFVYATADWCITCKINEKLVLNTQETSEFFVQHNVAVFEADWTHYDEHITTYLKSFKRAGVPLYVIYPTGKEPVILPQLLSLSDIKEQLGINE